MKKLMTVAKSKYYMLKVNFKTIFDEVDFELADHQRSEGEVASAEEQNDSDGDRLYQDLKRSDIDS